MASQERVKSTSDFSFKDQCDRDDGGSVQLTCFSEVSDDGCNSSKFGHLYASVPTRPNNTVGVNSLIGGASDNMGQSIARRLVIKNGLNVVLACNIPKNSPMLEANAEKKLVQKLISLGYTKS